MKCLILASGFGPRLYPLTINRAKALLEFRGTPLISHIVNGVPRGMDVLVTTNRKFEASFRQWSKSLGRVVTLCVEPVLTEDQSMGAVGSLNYCVTTNKIMDDLLVVAGDNFFESGLSEFISSYDGRTTQVGVYDKGDKSKCRAFGVVGLDGTRITSFDEKPVEPQSCIVATACYIFPTRIFPLLSDFCYGGKKDNLGNFIAHLIAKDEVHAYTFTGLWFDAGDGDHVLV
jgi:glucose-1-phosphate thymidylyltransferase